MIKHKIVKKIISSVIIASFCLQYGHGMPMPQKVEANEFEFVPGHIDTGYRAAIIEDVNTYALPLLKASALPTSYNANTMGHVTSVKNQGSLGTCWAFAAIASMESYAITHGLVANAESIDLSEYALASLTFDDSSFSDTVGTTSGDVTTSTNIYEELRAGGNDNYVFKTLSKWAGVMNESDYQYTMAGTIKSEYDRSKVAYILKNQYFINMANVEHIKKEIINNGAVASYYNADDKYANSPEGYPNYYHYTYESVSSNHAIAIVGWDDTIAKENFTIVGSDGIYTPNNDGAWLIKNSWGTYYGDGGYMWISYEDKVLSQSTACVYEIAPASEYQYNYQHDGGNIFGWSMHFSDISGYANVFNVSGTQKQDIKAVSVAVEDINKEYSVQLYRNPSEDAPTSGTPMLDEPVTGSTTYEGYYTIELPELVTVEPGDTFSVVIEFDSSTYIASAINGETNIGGGGTCTITNTCDNNQSYVYINGAYKDITDYYGESAAARVNFCIKAFAVDYVEEITASTITSISQEGMTGLTINWQRVKDGITYTLLRATSFDGEYTPVYTGTATTYTDTSVQKNTDYYYKVRVLDENDTPLDSNVKNGKLVITATALREVKDTSGGIVLTWDEIVDVTGYNIYRSKDGSAYDKIAFVQNVNTYTDSNAEFFADYNYYIKTVVGDVGSEEESVASNVMSISRKVSDFMVNNDVIDRAVLTWNNVESADGYVIYMGATDVDGEYDPKKEMADLPAGTNTYTIDISNLKRGQNAFFYIEAYYLDNGTKVRCDISPTSIYLLYEPVDNIKWYVDSNGRLVLKWNNHISDMTANQYYVRVYNDDSTGTFATVKLSSTNSTAISGLQLSNNYYVTVVPKNLMNTIYAYEQSPRVKVGGTMDSYNTVKINDITCNVGDKVTLTASLIDELANFDYSYQWYKASSKNGGGTPISGATGKEYVVDMSTPGVGYYYCIISIPYGGIKTASTNVAEVKTVTDISQCTMGAMSMVTYNTGAHTPDVYMTFMGIKLVKDVDYTLVYTNNVNAGVATVTITGKGVYTGSRMTTFAINPLSLNGADILSIPDHEFTGNAITPDVTVNMNGKVLVNGTDYSVTYSNNVNVGTATITITGKGNYSGAKTINYNIVKPTPTPTPTPTPNPVPESVTSNVVSVNQSSNTVSKLEVGTKVSTLINSVKEKQYAAVYSNGVLAGQDAVLATGMTLNIVDNGKICRTYTIIVTGDASCDGKVNITDLIAIKSHILKKSTLSDYKYLGGDTNGDGKVNITDFIKIKGYILKKNGISGVTVQ